MTSDALALARHFARVIGRRDHTDRAKRTDVALPEGLAARLGPDLTARYEALIAIALVALEMVDTRRERDALIARGRPDRAQPHGGRLCTAEKTALDLIKILEQEPDRDRGMPGDAAGHDHRPGNLKDRADQFARDLAPLYAQALATGCSSDGQVARFLNERRIEACGPGPWSENRAAALRRRLKTMGLASLALALPHAPGRAIATRQVRTRTRPPMAGQPKAIETLKDALAASIEASP